MAEVVVSITANDDSGADGGDAPLESEIDHSEHVPKKKVYPLEITLCKAMTRIACLICVVYPLISILVAGLFSIPLSVVGGWTPDEGFFEVLTEISNANSNVIANRESTPPSNPIVGLVIILAGFVSLGLFGCFLGLVSGGPLDRPVIKWILNSQSRLGKKWKTEIPKVQKIEATINNTEDLRLGDTPNPLFDPIDVQDTNQVNNLLRSDYKFYSYTRYNPNRVSPEQMRAMFTTHAIYMCTFCCLIIPIISATLALFFGGILYAAERNVVNFLEDGSVDAESEWTFQDAYYIVLSGLLEINVDLTDPPSATTTTGKIIVCIVSLWSSGFFFVILGLLSGPLLIPLVLMLDTKYALINHTKLNKCKVLKQVSCAAFVILPLFITLSSVVLGIVLNIVGPFTVGESISQVLQELTNMQIEIRHVDTSNLRGFTRFFMVMIGLYGICLFALSIGLMSYIFTPALSTMLNMAPDLSKQHPVRWSLWKLFIFLTLGIPLISLLIAGVFGGILGAVEGTLDERWNYRVGFFFILAELLGIEIDLYSIPQIENGFGKLIMAAMGLFSFSFFTMIIAVIGGPVLMPIIHYFAGTTYEYTKSDQFLRKNHVESV